MFFLHYLLLQRVSQPHVKSIAFLALRRSTRTISIFYRPFPKFILPEKKFKKAGFFCRVTFPHTWYSNYWAKGRWKSLTENHETFSFRLLTYVRVRVFFSVENFEDMGFVEISSLDYFFFLWFFLLLSKVKCLTFIFLLWKLNFICSVIC